MGGEGGALGSTHHLHVAAGKAGAAISARPAYGPSRRPGPLPLGRTPAVWSVPRFAAPALLAAAWRSHVPRTIHARRPSPTRDAVSGRLLQPGVRFRQAERGQVVPAQLRV